MRPLCIAPVALVAIVALAGCARATPSIVDAAPVTRLSVGYRGDYFWIQHDGAYPGLFDPHRARNVSDGRLRGRVCNVDFDYDAAWYGDRLHLYGRSDAAGHGTRAFSRTEGDVRLSLDVTESAPGHRRITGGQTPQWHSELPASIELEISPDRLVGTIGTRTYTLAADGDWLVGRWQRHGDVVTPIDAPYAIYGRQLLSTMVAADEALVLLWMMTCSSTIEHDGQMVRGFSLVALPPASRAPPVSPSPPR